MAISPRISASAEATAIRSAQSFTVPQFWETADVQERANGRTYTELQMALPRELSDKQRITLARKATQEFLGSRFPYTLAIHNPEAADKIEQPHLHLMFSERAVDDTTRTIPEERFFKRNGAKKDRKWNDQNKAEEVRIKWCAMMNQALENAGIDERVDPRSLADQGKVAESLLVEPKMLRRGTPAEKEMRRQEIAEIREAKAVLSQIEMAAPDIESILQADKFSYEKQKASVDQTFAWEAEELSMLDHAIEALKKKAMEILHAAANWFVKHGYDNPLENSSFKHKPAVTRALATQMARSVGLSEADRAKWIESGRVMADHLAELRYQDFKTKHPHQTEEWLRNSAMGLVSKPKQPDHSRGR